MSNPLFNVLGNAGGQQNGPMAFVNFMNQMKGKDPNAILQQMLSTGRVNQNQLNQAQQMAKQIEGQLNGVKSMFGFE